MIANEQDRIQFTAFYEDGREADAVDPVIFFRETDEAWYVTNPFSTYIVMKYPGMYYSLRQRADDVSHIIEALEKGKHA